MFFDFMKRGVSEFDGHYRCKLVALNETWEDCKHHALRVCCNSPGLLPVGKVLELLEGG